MVLGLVSGWWFELVLGLVCVGVRLCLGFCVIVGFANCLWFRFSVGLV